MYIYNIIIISIFNFGGLSLDKTDNVIQMVVRQYPLSDLISII